MNPAVKINSTLTTFNVNRTFNIILDVNTPKLIRAVKLYELQIAILSCKNIHTIDQQPDTFFISVNKQLVTSARTLASIKLLENEFSNLPPKFKNASGRLAKILIHTGTSALAEHLFLDGNGLMKILYALRPQTFDKELKLSTERAAAVTCLYDISLMFEKLKKRPRLKGGLKTASDILEDDCDCTNNTPRYYKINREIDSIKKNQRLLASVGALLWLSFHRTNILTPVPISRKLFATKLLRQASNAKELRRVVSDYHAVRSRLILRGYRLPALKLKIELPPSTITFKTMPEELLHGVI